MIKAWMMKGAAGGGGGFAPDDIAGLLAWHSASDIVGLNDGDPVSTWEDLTDNNNDFTQATADYRPLYKINIVNSLPALLYDGDEYNGDDRMVTPSITGIQTMAVVAKFTHAIFGRYNGLLTGTNSNIWFTGAQETDDWYVEENGITRYKDGVESAIDVTNTWHVFIGTAADARDIPVQLGMDRNAAPRSWSGYIAEVCIYDSVLTGDDFTNLNSYLMTKYGIT